MPKLHVLTGNAANNEYQIVVHVTTPPGNNSVGIAWPAALIAAGRNKSVMSIGTGPGQITQAEYDQIIAGTVIEGAFSFRDNPAWTAAERTAQLNAIATQREAELLARLGVELKWIGFTRS